MIVAIANGCLPPSDYNTEDMETEDEDEEGILSDFDDL
jgi:hypothetical protein